MKIVLEFLSFALWLGWMLFLVAMWGLGLVTSFMAGAFVGVLAVLFPPVAATQGIALLFGYNLAEMLMRVLASV